MRRKMMEQEILLKKISRKPLRQRNEMMDNFAQILRWLPTGDASSSSGHETPFKVQVNFDIPFVGNTKTTERGGGGGESVVYELKQFYTF
jgi:hypothetical protein